MQVPLVSIVIPCWNAEAFVGEAIESALGQTHANTEVIVIDDGSTDGSLDVIRAFGEQFYSETGPNRGACAARNRGFELARGDFIQFLDADDLIDPDKISLQVEMALRYPGDVIYCDRISHAADDPSRTWLDSPSEHADPLHFAVEKILLTTPQLYPRQALLGIGGYREGLPCAQDYDLHIRLALAGIGFRHLPKTLARIRRKEGSISSDSHKVLEQMRVLWRELVAELEARGDLTEERRALVAARMATAGRAYAKSGKYELAEECFDEARELHWDGADLAYDGPARLMRRILGAALTERIVMTKRRFLNYSDRPV